MNAVRTRSRLTLAVVAAAVMILTLVPAGPAAAGQFTGAVVGTATLSGGIGTCGTGNFSGTAAGLHGTAPANGPASATGFSYCNPDVVTGTANGSASAGTGLRIAGHNCSFAWNRIGLVAVVNLSGCDSSGSAVAAFAPIDPLGVYGVAAVGVAPA